MSDGESKPNETTPESEEEPVTIRETSTQEICESEEKGRGSEYIQE